MADRNGRKPPERASPVRAKADGGERSGARKNGAKVKLKPGSEGERRLDPNSTQSNKPR
jgi:hypothetical protein